MQLTSPAFVSGSPIPRRYTADGDDVSPPLRWRDVPAAARSLALLVDDPDAPDPASPRRPWVHWVVVDLPPRAGRLAAGAALPDGHAGLNDWGREGWGGPAPPRGRHRYRFTLFALDRRLGLARPTRADLERALVGHVLAEATLMGTYARG